MAQTTTGENACTVVLKVDNASGVLTDVSGSTNQASLDLAAQSAETFTFEGDYAIKKTCKKSITLALQALYSVTETEALNILMDWYFNSLGTSRTVQIDVPSSAVGGDRYSGEFILESLSLPLTADDAAVILVSAALSNDGEVVRSTIAS
jgi:hypothetical protein